MGFVKEFKDFAVKGNVMDLAIGVIIGAAFSTIVKSLVDDVITPLILKPALDAFNLTKLEDLTVMGAVKIGVFLSSVLNFLIVAMVLFMIVRTLNKIRKKQEQEVPAAPAEPSSTDKLLMEIRDELKKN